MQKTKLRLSFSLLVLSSTLISLSSLERVSANETEGQYRFKASPTCPLSKKVNREWQLVNADELSATETFQLHPTSDQKASNFYANHGLYSAPTSCFSAVEPEKTEVTKNESVQSSEPEKEEEHSRTKKEREQEEENESEFLHQAEAKIFEITPALGYTSEKANYQNISPSNLKTHGIVGSAIAEYGVTDLISVGASFAYDRLSQSSDPELAYNPNVRGFEDPKFFVNGKLKLEKSAIRLSLLLDTSLSHQTIQANGDSNAASGGLTFTPALGYEYYFGHNILGAQIAYDVFKRDEKHDTVDNAGAITTSTVQGGKVFTSALFFERRFRAGEYGLSLQYLISAHTTEDDVAVNDHGSQWIATLYGEWEFNERISLLPAFVYSRANFEDGQDSQNVKEVTGFGFSLGARFKF